jgi:ribonuclease P protein component
LGIKKEFSLKSKKSIGQLISGGKRLKSFPIHMVFKTPDESSEESSDRLKVIFTAPKRIHRSAVTRNRLKRLMREAFRPFIPQLEDFVEKQHKGIHLMLIYVGPSEVSLVDIREKIKVLLDRLEEQHKPSGTDE